MRRLMLALFTAGVLFGCGGEDRGSSAAPAAEPAAAPTPAGSAGETMTLPSGVQITHHVIGSGPSPSATDRVTVHYHGTFPDGTVFDSSVDRGEPVTFPLNRVIDCWTEGVQTMKVGGKALLVCPPNTAYGQQGTPNGQIPPNSTLHFEVELIAIPPA
jgi:FKBP-type peptidyl-prolyl cis-trans isomerase FkpA